MKLFSISLVCAALVVLFSGCASSENSYYTPTQVRAQHAGYDPTPHAYGTRY